VSDPGHTTVSDARGPVHAGHGDVHSHVYNFGHADPGTVLADLLGKGPRRVPEDQLLWLQQRFVYPAGLGHARGILERAGTVLLNGAPGTGRSAAAGILLHELPPGAGVLHELVPDDGENTRLGLQPDSVGESDRLLLDLSAVDEGLWVQAHDQLSSFRHAVSRRSAHLVVVLPAGRAARLRPDLKDFQADLLREPGIRVLRSHLRCAGIGAEDTQQVVPALAAYLDRQPAMREIAELADLIDRARKSDLSQDGFPGWCEQALDAVQDRAGEAALLVEQLGEGPQRALLLATAMLHRAHSDHIHAASERLLDTVRSPHTDLPLLERADLAQRFKEIQATAGPDNIVRFTPLGFDKAVRGHFWTHMPALRPYLRIWVAGTVESAELPEETQDALVGRFAAQCLRTGLPDHLFITVERWTTSPRPTRARLRAAAQTLEHGLGDAEHARLFRKRIYDWACEGSHSEGFTQVLVAVCAGVIAPRHPDQAVVRLHHLTRHARPGDTSAHDALLTLVRADRRLHRLMLDRLSRPPVDSYWPADSTLFMELTDPAVLADAGARTGRLLADPVVQEHLTTGWAETLRRLPVHDWTAHVTQWLAAAGADPSSSDLLLNILVTAAMPRADLLGHVYTITRAWAVTGPGPDDHRGAIADRLLSKISLAQRSRRLIAEEPEQGDTAP